jgi:hypothetical protein
MSPPLLCSSIREPNNQTRADCPKFFTALAQITSTCGWLNRMFIFLASNLYHYWISLSGYILPHIDLHPLANGRFSLLHDCLGDAIGKVFLPAVIANLRGGILECQ